MDLLFLYGGQQFVWDAGKASINLDKHGIAFEKACQVFFDPFVDLKTRAISENREMLL